VAGTGLILSLWHCIAGFGALRLRNWARYNLIILAVLELPATAVPLTTSMMWQLLPVSFLSLLVLLYLLRPAVARIFEVGTGPATLPATDADVLEHVIRRRPLRRHEACCPDCPPTTDQGDATSEPEARRT
jgi:hypothetical protein